MLLSSHGHDADVVEDIYFIFSLLPIQSSELVQYGELLKNPYTIRVFYMRRTGMRGFGILLFMFYKKTYLDKSNTHGIGLFAGEEIKKEDIIWMPTKEFISLFSQEELDALDSSDKQMVQHYGYFHKENNEWHFAGDNSRFINHSTESNIIRTDNTDGVRAVRDIDTGEELLQNYSDFEDLRPSI